MSRSRIIALDAMGGDYGPESVIPGAVLTLKAHPQLGFILFGDEGQIGPLLDRESALKAVSTVVHTEHKILSNEKPSAVLRKSKGSSMRLAIEAVKEGRATAVVSAGNTGALMALAKMVLTPLPGIHRPAIASIFPTRQSDTIMLDRSNAPFILPLIPAPSVPAFISCKGMSLNSSAYFMPRESVTISTR